VCVCVCVSVSVCVSVYVCVCMCVCECLDYGQPNYLWSLTSWIARQVVEAASKPSLGPAGIQQRDEAVEIPKGLEDL